MIADDCAAAFIEETARWLAEGTVTGLGEKEVMRAANAAAYAVINVLGIEGDDVIRTHEATKRFLEGRWPMLELMPDGDSVREAIDFGIGLHLLAAAIQQTLSEQQPKGHDDTQN